MIDSAGDLPHIVDVFFVGDAEDQDLRAVDGLLLLVEGVLTSSTT